MRGLQFDLVRITIEMKTAFIVGASDGDNIADAVFVTDANGLPFIPGTTLAGILRHALAEDDPDVDAACKDAFGYQNLDDGQSSRVTVSAAQVHGDADRPVPFRTAAVAADAVLQLLAAGARRDHVRIGEHGAVDGNGKFDRRLVPAGARFTFELVVHEGAGEVTASRCVNTLASRAVRIGGHTRSGLGAFDVVRAEGRKFDLTTPTDFSAWSTFPVALHQPLPPATLKPYGFKAQRPASAVEGTLKLRAVDTFLTRGIQPTGREPKPDGQKEGATGPTPLVEQRIHWTGSPGAQKGSVGTQADAPFLVPGSGIKGALRHRALFHARRRLLVGGPADGDADQALEALFGAIKDGDTGAPGRVSIDDTYVDATAAKYALFQHVSLDRLTQGPMDGLLFDEVALSGVALETPITLEPRHLDGLARGALADALKDLCEGRLPLGASRSHGRFTGEVVWSDGGNWMKEQP